MLLNNLTNKMTQSDKDKYNTQTKGNISVISTYHGGVGLIFPKQYYEG